jgi:23S rRNA pseudouridine1911/1915/1917 synthase
VKDEPAPNLVGDRKAPGKVPRVATPPVLHEDDTLIAFDKPAGLPVAPERGVRDDDSLLARIQAAYGPGVSMVHRLDAEASGIVLCAKAKPALDFLSGQFQAKAVAKIHHALVSVPPLEGEPRGREWGPDGTLAAEFSITFALEEDRHQAGRMLVAKKRGRPCQTDIRVLERFGRFAWIECRPQTGRRHQIRAHVAAVGIPILNDLLYGDPTAQLLLSSLKRGYKGREDEKPLIMRLALHASSLTFTHPATQAPMTLSSPLPHEFEVALKYLRKFTRTR